MMAEVQKRVPKHLTINLYTKLSVGNQVLMKDMVWAILSEDIENLRLLSLV
jgi:hypothetical protein